MAVAGVLAAPEATPLSIAEHLVPSKPYSRVEALAKMLEEQGDVALVRILSVATVSEPDISDDRIFGNVPLRPVRFEIVRTLRGELQEGPLDAVTIESGLSERAVFPRWATFAGVDSAGAIVALLPHPRRSWSVYEALPLPPIEFREAETLIAQAHAENDLDSLVSRADLVIVGRTPADSIHSGGMRYQFLVNVQRTLKGKPSGEFVSIRSRLPLPRSRRGVFFLKRAEDGVFESAPAHRSAWAMENSPRHDTDSTFTRRLAMARAAVNRSSSRARH